MWSCIGNGSSLIFSSCYLLLELSYLSTYLFFDIQALESFYEQFDPDFINIRTKAREVLQREDDLNEIVQVRFIALMSFTFFLG